MQKHKFFFLLSIVFISITIINFSWHAYGYRNDIFAKFNASYWTYRYNHSQWSSSIKCLVTDPHINPYKCVWDDNWYQLHKTIPPQFQKISIGDDGLYAYAGYTYITGADPTQLNAELPPFGKYLVGLFEVTTGTMGAFSLFFTALSLVLLFFFSKFIFKSSFFASLSTLIFSFEPLLIEQMRAPYLDTLYLSLFLLSAMLFLKQKYIWSGLTLGLFMSVKSPFLGILVLLVYFLVLLVSKKKIWMPMVLLAVAAVVTYILTYLRMFLLGYGLIHFLQVQKYIIHFYSTGAKGVIGAVVPMLLQGKWATWFGSPQNVTEWTILWLLGIFGTVFSFVVFLKTKEKTEGLWLHVIWIIGYMAFLIVTPIFPRYLLLLLPFMYNLSIWAFLKSIRLKYS